MTKPIGELVMAAVCDIRGFTDMTAMVDAVNWSQQVNDRVKRDLIKDYHEIIRISQKQAAHELFQPFLKSTQFTEKYNSENLLRCALKATGDGFLIAFSISAPVGKNGHKPMKLRDQRIIARPLFKGLATLIGTSAIGKFCDRALEGFLRKWELHLALALAERRNWDRVHDRDIYPDPGYEEVISWEHHYPAYFRIAGAMAIGTGRILDIDYPGKKKDFPEGTKNHFDIKFDALGHGVNVAFRLCDYAGRGDRKHRTPNDSPYQLLDRRVGQLLISKDRVPDRYVCDRCDLDAEVLGGQNAEIVLSKVRFAEVLKGIDELWCYGATLGVSQGQASNLRRKK